MGVVQDGQARDLVGGLGVFHHVDLAHVTRSRFATNLIVFTKVCCSHEEPNLSFVTVFIRRKCCKAADLAAIMVISDAITLKRRLYIGHTT